MIVKDYIKTNDDIRIRLDAKESRDSFDPFIHPFWQGNLKDIPEKYQGLEVISEGWMMDAEINSISVYAPDMMYEKFEIMDDSDLILASRRRGR